MKHLGIISTMMGLFLAIGAMGGLEHKSLDLPVSATLIVVGMGLAIIGVLTVREFEWN